MRAPLAVLLAAAGCAAPSASYERSLRDWLRAPEAQRESRLTDLLAMGEEAHVEPGVRLAAVHQALRAGRVVDVEALLDAEVADFPGAARFLASYREMMQLAPRSTAAPAQGVVLVVVADRTHQRDVVADFLATIERPLRSQGHYAVPVEVGGDLLAWLDLVGLQEGLPDAAALRRLAELGIATCLVVDILDFWVHEALVVEAARHDVRYRMIDTATADVRWDRAAAGYYERLEPGVFAADDDTFFYPSSLGPVFQDQIDFVRAMNRGSLRTLPPAAGAAPAR